jgi:hypothetical protein
MNSILTVTTAASSYDLTALATVKTELGITDNTENDKLRTWITQASIIAASYCRRVFARETLTETFRPARNCSSHVEFLILQRRPIASITSVTVDDVAVDAAEYETDANPGLLYRLDSSGYRSCWSASKSIIVVYLAGYILLDTLPQDIERAVIMMVKDMRADATRDPNLRSKRIEGVSEYQWWIPGEATTQMPIEISGLLDPYRQPWVG